MIDPETPDFTNTPVCARRPAYCYAPLQSDARAAVSVVTPFFNAGREFNETAESVIRQSFQQWEWIIVDDCSDDPESLRILKEWAAREPRIRILVSDSRRGPGAARNIGVRSAQTEYVAFLDSDDLFEPTALEKWLWFLECHRQYAMVKGYQAGFGAEGYIWREGFHSGPAILERNLIQTASMIRRDVYLEVGGMDEDIRGGMEDWDFWLRCANRGHWGGTIPEVLDWYRRRSSHHDRWQDWDGAQRERKFREKLLDRYPKLFSGGFPHPEHSFPAPYAELPGLPAFENRLARAPGMERLLVIVPHLVLGGSDKFTLDLIAELVSRHSFQVTVASTLPSAHPWRHRFESLTPDVFTLDTFLRLRDYPRFLSYLMRSRQIDSVLVTHSQLGYQLLPYLRSQFPSVRYCDYVHIEEPQWKEGGYPAYSINYSPFLDHTGASSQHLKSWMVDRGGDAGKTTVVTTNIDAEEWRRDRFDAAMLRQKWNVPENIPVILFAGRVCEQKQPHVLAATIRELHRRKDPFLCLIAGDGEGGPWLRDYAARYALDKLRMLGSRSNEEVRELLAISDIFFLPSRHEGIALSIYEAMSMSVVVVGADVGGQRELVVPECGCLIEPGSGEAERYAEVISGLLADESKRRTTAANARQRIVDHYSLVEMGAKMAELLRRNPESQPLDVSAAFLRFAPGLAREIIEQRRTEQIADQLWSQRGAQLPPPDGAPRPIHRSEAKTVRLLRAVALLRPLLTGRENRENRKLLLSVLSRSGRRQRLFQSFDREFYRCSNPDVPSPGPFPLLHYVFYGYREGRRPSPDFDIHDLTCAAPNSADTGANPLLRKIVLAAQTVALPTGR